MQDSQMAAMPESSVWIVWELFIGYDVDHSLKKTELRGYCTSYPKISMFCALSSHYQHLFEK